MKTETKITTATEATTVTTTTTWTSAMTATTAMTAATAMTATAAITATTATDSTSTAMKTINRYDYRNDSSYTDKSNNSIQNRSYINRYINRNDSSNNDYNDNNKNVNSNGDSKPSQQLFLAPNLPFKCSMTFALFWINRLPDVFIERSTVEAATCRAAPQLLEVVGK